MIKISILSSLSFKKSLPVVPLLISNISGAIISEAAALNVKLWLNIKSPLELKLDAVICVKVAFCAKISPLALKLPDDVMLPDEPDIITE